MGGISLYAMQTVDMYDSTNRPDNKGHTEYMYRACKGRPPSFRHQASQELRLRPCTSYWGIILLYDSAFGSLSYNLINALLLRPSAHHLTST